MATTPEQTVPIFASIEDVSMKLLLKISELNAENLLIFAAVGASCASLGLVMEMQRNIARADWSRNAPPHSDWIAKVEQMKLGVFLIAGFSFMVAIFCLLLSTMLKGQDESVLAQNIRILLFNVGFFLIIASLFAILIWAVNWTIRLWKPPTSNPAPTAQAPATQAPATQAPATQAPATQAPAAQAPATQAPTGQAPATQAPTGQAPAGQADSGQADSGQADDGEANDQD